MITLLLSLAAPAGLSLRPAHATPSYQPHGPIVIDGNAGFTSDNGVIAGAGTIENPYFIEGWNITAPSGIGILIRNTDAFFRAASNYIAITNGNGRVLANVNNGGVP